MAPSKDESRAALSRSFRIYSVKFVLHIVDQCCIYLLIAGTYTPILTVTLKSLPFFSVVCTRSSIRGATLSGAILSHAPSIRSARLPSADPTPGPSALCALPSGGGSLVLSLMPSVEARQLPARERPPGVMSCSLSSCRRACVRLARFSRRAS